ncbi:hypothetical protein B0T17DRAFT_324197 [Bombardia bombarda]|uniref:DNA repair protein REV1 n=1 Tax=Bombardia bombarda TaxID=252184 RepID=A0AA40BYE1_9PEZI|nr:hypothetical protein B0T17DRAFT_324197 [Bombardia bombarda]
MATHIIASAMPPKKAVDFTKYRVVKPAWVTDSIQAGRLLPWTDYRVIDHDPRQKTIQFDGGKMFSQTAQQSPRGYREQTQNRFYTSQPQKTADSREFSSPRQPRSMKKEVVSAGEGMQQVDKMDLDMPVERPITPDRPSSKSVNESREQPNTVPPNRGTESLETLAPEKTTTSGNPPEGRAMTSEQHNALLLSDPNIRKSSTANPDFLKQFYSESRLHHLSTWKSQLKSRMQSLAAEKGPTSKGIRRKGSRRYIMHVDFDSFFCAVSLKRAPEYRDKPAVVAHSAGSGSEIASCNYPARKFGVKNGMWMKRALELCPDLKTLPYDFPAYEEASRQFYDAILEVGGVVQSVSIDEALVDITNIVLSATGSEGVGVDEGSSWREQEKADEIASMLREKVKSKTDCHVSVGIGGNILLAKVALRKAKPAGQYQIRPEEVSDILGELRVEDLPGVAYSIGGRLEEVGVKLVKDIRQTSKERLVSLLGPKTGERLWEYARGIDRVEVGEQPIRKSVSADVNWGIRFISQDEAEEFVRNLSKELERRLLSEGVKGKHLTMKIMRRALDAPLDPPKHLGHGKCDTFNKSVSFGVATNNGELIGKEAVAILRSHKFSPGDLRGLGVQMTKLEPLKPSTAAPDGSQKKLTFGNLTLLSGANRQRAEQIDDETSPQKTRRASSKDVESDPITVDPLTPRKPRVHPALAIAKANSTDEKARTPLNITGTQFIMPSHPDPSVLAELPHDIRSKLLGQVQRTSAAARSRETSPAIKSRSQSPALTDDMPSDIDPEVFDALPEDMKLEILASHRRKRRRQGGGQNVLPQSPRKDRVIHLAKEHTTPTKRGLRDMFSRAREREKQNDAEANLLQTSFIPARAPQGGAAAEDQAGIDLVEDPDSDCLAELPEDMRREIMDDHRRRRLAQLSGLNLQAPTWRRRLAAADDAAGEFTLPGGQTTINFPARPPKISFAESSAAAATSPKQIKDMLLLWHESTQKEGPHRGDVEVLEKYLGKVITEERDMDKVRKLVRWLDWVVEDGVDGAGKRGWREALESVKGAVQGAMRARGLGGMEFG